MEGRGEMKAEPGNAQKHSLCILQLTLDPLRPGKDRHVLSDVTHLQIQGMYWAERTETVLLNILLGKYKTGKRGTKRSRPLGRK